MGRNMSFNSTTTKDLEHKSCFMESHMKKSNKNDNVTESYYYGNDQDDGLMCWPPRCYTCSFCKREFKSAQALGGHMNVHRRDRAKLLMRHHSPPSLPTDKYRYSLPNFNNLEPNTNPSPGFSPPSPSRISHYSGVGGNSHEIRRKYWGKGVGPNNDHLKSTSAKALFGVEKLDSFCMQEKNFVRLDLEIGLFTESKQDLDLELRLGYT